MSTLLDIQEDVAAAINADEWLVQGGCEAFAEDRSDTLQRLDIKLHNTLGIAITILTPVGKAQGSRNVAGIPLELPVLVVQCQEIPALNREAPGHISALQAAQHIAFLLDQPSIRFSEFVQGGDSDTEIVTVQVLFRTSIILTDPAEAVAPAE